MPIITDQEGNGKAGPLKVPTSVLIALVVVLACTGSFGLGFLAGKHDGGGEVKIYTPEETEADMSAIEYVPTPQVAAPVVAATDATVTGGKYVASKSGTKYHLLSCPGAKQIKESNKIYFNTKEDAEAAGYEPAANCKGM